MLALWIFGDNVEDAVGHFRYVLFYLLGGVAAAMTQMAIDPASNIPMVGASGAIAAVMGAYLSLYPSSPITILNPFVPLWFFFGLFFELPAWVVAVEFFVVNLMSGMSSLASSRHGLGGVAFFAHVGGVRRRARFGAVLHDAVAPAARGTAGAVGAPLRVANQRIGTIDATANRRAKKAPRTEKRFIANNVRDRFGGAFPAQDITDRVSSTVAQIGSRGVTIERSRPGLAAGSCQRVTP